MDLRFFFFILILVCLYRVIFMGIMHAYISSDTGAGEILLANWMGLRLSLKTAGGTALLPFVFLTLGTFLFPCFKKAAGKIRLFTERWQALSFTFSLSRAFHSTINFTPHITRSRSWRGRMRNLVLSS